VPLALRLDGFAAHSYLVARLPRARQRANALHDDCDVRRRPGALEKAHEPVLRRRCVQHQLATWQQQRGAVVVVTGPRALQLDVAGEVPPASGSLGSKDTGAEHG
jgi:hypothetical protein